MSRWDVAYLDMNEKNIFNVAQGNYLYNDGGGR